MLGKTVPPEAGAHGAANWKAMLDMSVILAPDLSSKPRKKASRRGSGILIQEGSYKSGPQVPRMSCAYVSRDSLERWRRAAGSTRDSLSTEDGAVKSPTGQGDITD